MMRKLGCLLLLTFFLSGFTIKNNDEVKNFYGISEVITYDNVQYKLVASYHPNEHYYKQEYIPAGESAEHFNRMLIIDFYITDALNKQVAQLKEKELDKRKAIDAVVNYEKFENVELGEYMLDFVLSDANQDKISVVEHNTYRYKNYTDKAGHKGVLLLAISQRGYLEKIGDFLKSVKESKIDGINKLVVYQMPKIEIN
jgi:hypothetical protein